MCASSPLALEALLCTMHPVVCSGYAQGILRVPETTDSAEIYTLCVSLCKNTATSNL